MCLDIQLRKLSGGKMGTQELMRELAKSYGKDKPFKDNELFDKITALTYPEIGTFFKRHVAGATPLPYAEILGMAGLRYEPLANREILTLGKAEVKPNRETNRLKITNIDGVNKFGETLGYMVGDEIVSFDEVPTTLENADEVFAKFQTTRKEGYKVKVVVARPDGKGGFVEKSLKAKAIAVKIKGMNLVTIDPAATPDQVAVRKSWLGQ